MPKVLKKTPALWQALGYLTGIPAAAFLYHIAQNEYFLSTGVMRTGLVVVIVACLIYRFGARRPAHLLLWVGIYLSLYNFIMVAGGFLFLGWWTLALVAGASAISMLVLYGASLRMRLGVALIIVSVLGVLPLYFERDFDQDRCEAEDERRSPAFFLLDQSMHCYDFAKLSAPPRLVATQGLEGKLLTFDLESLRRISRNRAPWRGIQRLTPHPKNATLFATAWGKWHSDQVVGEIDPETGELIRDFSSPGCVNAFEVAVDDRRDRIYLLCETTHNLLAYEQEADRPFKTVTLRGWNSYDLLLDRQGSALFVSDWLSPYLSVVDVGSMTLTPPIRIGWTAFGMVEGADGIVYVARPLASEVVAVNPTTRRVERRMKAEFGARALELDPNRGILFVGNYFDGTLDLLDAQTGERLTRHYAGRLLRGLYYDRDGDRIFVAAGCGLYWARVSTLLQP